jgi:hypothetical protein
LSVKDETLYSPRSENPQFTPVCTTPVMQSNGRGGMTVNDCGWRGSTTDSSSADKALYDHFRSAHSDHPRPQGFVQPKWI